MSDVKLTKRRARDIARLYVQEMLLADDMPDWPFDKSLIAVDDDRAIREFQDEVLRIAERIGNSITDAGRAALTRQSTGDAR